MAGDNPGRLKSEAALAALCGTSPLQVSSGKTVRHRLNSPLILADLADSTLAT
ncbi:transposase [Paraburkholderia sp. BL27I4N3]|uniref:transposase n=1 Tax=Paraburkholderia sp. BL27I4N3 TaxID=1938805 RepID=UPI0021621C46|nr:transposase [Paraburkholderia sp. BL27I4N3]